MKKLLSVAIAAGFLSLAVPVNAQSPVQGTMAAFVVETKDDKEVLKKAVDVEPRQLVEYQLTYVNKGNSGIKGLTVVGPVPEGTSYISDTALTDTQANLRVSIDGGVTFEKEPVIREVVAQNGEVTETIIPAEKYTHIQWQSGDMLAGEGGKQLYRYRVRVK